MEDIQSLLQQLEDADAAGDTAKATAIADEISKLDAQTAAQAGPDVTNTATAGDQAPAQTNTPAAPPVDPVLQGALTSMEEADAASATDPLEKMRAEEIAKRIELGTPAALKKADFTNDVEVPEFKYVPHDVVNPNKFRYNYQTPGPNVEQSTLKEEDLIHDPNWLASARILYKMNKGYEFEGSDQDLHNYGLMVSSTLNNNFAAIGQAYAYYKGANPKAVKALIYNIEAGQATDTNWSNTGRALGAQLGDPSNYIGGFALKAVAGEAIKVSSVVALKQLLKRELLLASGTEGAVLASGMGGQDVAKQDLKVDAGQQEAIDWTQAALQAGIGGAAGMGLSALGAGVGVLMSKEGRAALAQWIDDAKNAGWETRTDIGNDIPMGDGWRSAYIDENGNEVMEPPQGTMTKVIDANGNESAPDVQPGGLRDQFLKNPPQAKPQAAGDLKPGDARSDFIFGPPAPRAAADLQPGDARSAFLRGATEAPTDQATTPAWTTKIALDDGSEVDVPTWEKMMAEGDKRADLTRPIEPPEETLTPKAKQERAAGDKARTNKMASGTAKDVETGISEITQIVKNERFDKIPGNHAEATRVVARIVEPILEVFKRGVDDEIGDVLMDPVKSNDLLAIKDAVTTVMSKVKAEALKASESYQAAKSAAESSPTVTKDMVDRLDTLEAEWKKWTDLSDKVQPVYNKLGSFAGLLLNHSQMVQDGIGAAARRISFKELREKGFNENEVMSAFIQAAQLAHKAANESKLYRSIKRDYFKALAEGNMTALDTLAKKLEKELQRQAKLKGQKTYSFFSNLTRGIMEYYTNSLLFNFKTLQINAMTAWAEHALRGAYGRVGGILSMNAGHAIRRGSIMRQAMRQSRSTARSMAFKALMEDFTDHGARYADMEHNVIPGKLGKTVRIPMRIMALTDTFTAHQSYIAEVAATSADQFAASHAGRIADVKALLAKADAKAKPKLEARLKKLNEGYDEKLKAFVEKRIDEAFDEKGNRTNTAAITASEDVLFKREFDRTSVVEGFFGRGEDILRAAPLLRILVPFYRTPIRVVEAGIKYSPGVNLLLHKTFREDFLGRNGTYARDVARGRMLFATSLMLTTYGWAASGNITGGGPLDPAAKKSLMDTGWKPYHIRLPGTDTWLDYSRMDPIAFPMKLIANFSERHRMYQSRAEAGEKEDSSELADYLLMGAASFAGAVKDINMLQGLNKFFNMWEIAQQDEEWGIKRDQMGKELAQLIQGFVPNFVRKIGDAVEPDRVDPQTLNDIIRASLPGARGPVNLSYTITGKVRTIGNPVEGFVWLPWGGVNDTPDGRENYVYSELAIAEMVTGKPLRLPYTHPDYAGLDLRTVRTSDNSMSMYDLYNRVLSNTTYNGVTLQDALYKELKRNDSIGQTSPGNSRYISDRTKNIKAILNQYRDIAWEKGVRPELEKNEVMKARKQHLDMLKGQANEPFKYSIEQLLGPNR